MKIIYDGKNLWGYSKLLNTYSKTPCKPEDISLQSILSSPDLRDLPLTKKNIMRMGRKIESATIEDVEFEGKKSHLIKIKGKEELLGDYNLSLWISSNSYYPIQSEYEMKGGSQKGDSQKDLLSATNFSIKVKMRFTINTKVSDDIFVFKPPEGAKEE
jgi:outer membrane lipoprotein-sorting protein